MTDFIGSLHIYIKHLCIFLCEYTNKQVLTSFIMNLKDCTFIL